MPPLWRHPAFRWTVVCLTGLVLSATFWWGSAESSLFDAEFAVGSWLDEFLVGNASYALLPVLGFAGGVLVSFSPCILPLVPLNLAFIGANEASGLRSLGLSLRFVAGAAAVLALLGTFGDLAGLLLVEQRGIMLLAVGVALIYFGLVVAEAVPDAFSGWNFTVGRRLGPFGAGAAFSLVATPCSSPILGGLLAVAATHPGWGSSVATLVAFSLGYTSLVFLGGVFGGALVASAKRLQSTAPRAVAAGLLVVSGVTVAASGISWF